MGNKILKKEFDPKYGWVTADTKQSSGFTQFEKAAKLYKETYGVDPNPKATSWTKGKMDEELLRWYKSATNPNVTNNPTSKKLMDLQARGIADPVALKAAKKDPAALPYWQQYTVQKGKKTVPLTIKDIKKQTPPEDFDKSRDTLAAAQLRDPSKKYYSNATTKALKSAQRIEGNVKFEQLMRADPTNYTDVVLTRYYDSPNATLKSRNGRAFVNVGGPKNISKSLGGEDLADETFKYYQGLAKAGELGQDWAAVDGNQYIQKGTFGGKEAFFTPYDYAIHGVPTGERGRDVVTNIASLDPNYWRTSGNLQKIGDKYGFVTEANPFAAQVGGTNQQLTPEEVAFVQSTKKKKGLGGLGGGLSSLLTLGGQMLIGGPGALNPFGPFNPSVFAFGIPNTLSSVAGLGAGSNPKSPKTWTRTLQTPQWQPQQQPQQQQPQQQQAQPMAQTFQQPVQQAQQIQQTQPVKQMAGGGMVDNQWNPVQVGNPVNEAAKGLASLGRNNDSMLMHVTPNEVAGLQGIAEKMGGSLTINPQTGLPEAGFFDGIGNFLGDLLPTAVGSTVGALTLNPWLGAAAGGATGFAKGKLEGKSTQDALATGILSGWGAYSGGDLLKGIGNFGKQGAETAANIGKFGPLTSTNPTDLASQALGVDPDTAANITQYGAMTEPMAQTLNTASAASPVSLGDIGQGLQGLTQPGGFDAYAKSIGTTPGTAALKLATPLAAPALSAMAPEGPMGLPELGMSGWGNDPFMSIESRRKQNIAGMAEGGQVPTQPKRFGLTNESGVMTHEGVPQMGLGSLAKPGSMSGTPGSASAQFDDRQIGSVNQPLTQFRGFNVAQGEGNEHAPNYDPLSATIQNQYARGGDVIGQATPPLTKPRGFNVHLGEGFEQTYSNPFNNQMKRGGLLNGAGDGISDSIPATIEGKQPARLADGEFVIPARIVSEVGHGSTKAGARKLYAWMDKVEAKSKSRKNVAAKTNVDKLLPT